MSSAIGWESRKRVILAQKLRQIPKMLHWRLSANCAPTAYPFAFSQWQSKQCTPLSAPVHLWASWTDFSICLFGEAPSKIQWIFFLRGNLKEGAGRKNFNPCHCSWSQDYHWYSSALPFFIHFSYPSPSATISMGVGSFPGSEPKLSFLDNHRILSLVHCTSSFVGTSGYEVPRGPQVIPLSSTHLPFCLWWVSAALPLSFD